MGIDPATAMLGASAISAVAGGMQKSNAVPSTNGFDAYPQQVKDYMIKTLLPQIQNAGAAPYQAPPMVRAAPNAGGANFANPQMQQLQNYSDAVGGLFQPQGRNQGGMPAVRANGGFAPAQGQMPGQGQQQPGQGAGQMTPQMAAQQFLQQTTPQGRQSQIGNYVNQGATSLGDLGNALLGQGYTGGKVTPGTGAGNIDYAALYKALGI